MANHYPRIRRYAPRPVEGMVPLPRANLRGATVGAVRAAILEGELVSGTIYSAPALASRLGVSATPVREAMLELTRAGLVESVPNRGFRIRVLDADDLAEIHDLRELIEVPAVVRVAKGGGSGLIDLLDPFVDALEQAVADDDLAGYLQADRSFHLGLVALAGNRRLTRTVSELRDQAWLAGLPSGAAADAHRESVGDHREILTAVAQRDARGARRLMREHLDRTHRAWVTATDDEFAGPDDESPDPD